MITKYHAMYYARVLAQRAIGDNIDSLSQSLLNAAVDINPLFKQERPGLNEKIFTLYKFRSMTDERDENGELLPDSVRLTKFGKFLRSTSLDELPELFNILKGDMSIIGPRPLLVQYWIYVNIVDTKTQIFMQFFLKHLQAVEESYNRYCYEAFFCCTRILYIQI